MSDTSNNQEQSTVDCVWTTFLRLADGDRYALISVSDLAAELPRHANRTLSEDGVQSHLENLMNRDLIFARGFPGTYSVSPKGLSNELQPAPDVLPGVNTASPGPIQINIHNQLEVNQEVVLTQEQISTLIRKLEELEESIKKYSSKPNDQTQPGSPQAIQKIQENVTQIRNELESGAPNHGQLQHFRNSLLGIVGGGLGSLIAPELAKRLGEICDLLETAGTALGG